MRTTVTLLRYLVVVVVVALLGGLAGWFFFVRSHQSTIQSQEDGSSVPGQRPLYGDGTGPNAPFVQGSGSTTTIPTPESPRAIVQLWRVDSGPVAGFSFIAPQKTASSSHLYFALRANGNIFDADAGAQSVTRLTNTLIPKTYEALFSPKGGTVLIRSLENGSIATLLGSFATPASTTTFPQTLSGPTLPVGIRAVAIDPDPKSGLLFYLAPGTTGGVVGMVSNLSNSKPMQLFSSPIGSWRARFAAGNVFLLLSPADNVPGYAYTLSGSGILSLSVGPIPGLMVLPHSTQDVLVYSSSSGGQITLYAQVGKQAPVQLSVQTVAEKCVWGVGKSLTLYCAVPKAVPSSGFIDAWYQGVLHTNDTWWKIDVQSGSADELYAPDAPVDVHDPHIDASGSYIAYTNGVDLSLWVLRLVQ